MGETDLSMYDFCGYGEYGPGLRGAVGDRWVRSAVSAVGGSVRRRRYPLGPFGSFSRHRGRRSGCPACGRPSVGPFGSFAPGGRGRRHGFDELGPFGSFLARLGPFGDFLLRWVRSAAFSRLGPFGRWLMRRHRRSASFDAGDPAAHPETGGTPAPQGRGFLDTDQRSGLMTRGRSHVWVRSAVFPYGAKTLHRHPSPARSSVTRSESVGFPNSFGFPRGGPFRSWGARVRLNPDTRQCFEVPL